MKYITGKYGVWLLAFSCWLLAVSCSSDSAGEQPTGSTLQVVPYTANYQGNQAMSRRAVAEGYTAYTPDHDISIGLYILPEDNPTPKLIRYSNGVWHSQAVVATNVDYTIYGFMPKSMTSGISQSGGNTILTLSDIDAVSAEDICFVTGVKNMEGDLKQGVFNYHGESTNNFVRLLLDHLFAAVKFDFSVDAEYSALRTIKLRKMTLSTTKEKVSATITLAPNTTGADPVTGVSYSSTGTAAAATFFENAAGIELSAANAETISRHLCCFVPDQSSALTLECIYDVYDRKGNKIREDCKATNKLPNLSASRGQCVTVKLNVAPTYLGQLSDADLEFTLTLQE